MTSSFREGGNAARARGGRDRRGRRLGEAGVAGKRDALDNCTAADSAAQYGGRFV
jgi:hypothetical protein